MIGISFNRKNFEYDAYTLIKAFYPKEDVVTFYEGVSLPGMTRLRACGLKGRPDTRS